MGYPYPYFCLCAFLGPYSSEAPDYLLRTILAPADCILNLFGLPKCALCVPFKGTIGVCIRVPFKAALRVEG